MRKRYIVLGVILLFLLVKPVFSWFQRVGYLHFESPTAKISGATTSLELESPIIIWDGNTGDLYMKTYQDADFDDDDTINLPDATAGMGYVSCGSDGAGEGGFFTYYDDDPVILTNSTNFQEADADSKLVIMDGGDTTTVKNTNGDNQYLVMTIWYYSL